MSIVFGFVAGFRFIVTTLLALVAIVMSVRVLRMRQVGRGRAALAAAWLFFAVLCLFANGVLNRLVLGPVAASYRGRVTGASLQE